MIKTALLFALVPLLAQVSPQSDPTSYTSIGWILIALFALVGMANQGIDLWRKMFPADHPPAHQLYATKAELKALEDALTEEISAMDEKLDETCSRIEKRFESWLEQMDGKLNTDHRELQHWKEGVERVIGRVEAKVESLENKSKK